MSIIIAPNTMASMEQNGCEKKRSLDQLGEVFKNLQMPKEILRPDYLKLLMQLHQDKIEFPQ